MFGFKDLMRHSLRLFKFHEQSASAPVETVEEECKRIVTIIQEFLDKNPSNVRNMDETLFFYAAIPDKVILVINS
jgi:hypothetical protein